MADNVIKEEYFRRILDAHVELSRRAGWREGVLEMPPPWLDIVRLAGFSIQGLEELREDLPDFFIPRAYLLAEGVLLPKHSTILVSDTGSATGLNLATAHEAAHLLLGNLCTFEPHKVKTLDEHAQFVDKWNEIEQQTNLVAYELLLPEFFFKTLTVHLSPYFIAQYCFLDTSHIILHTLHLADIECEFSGYSLYGPPEIIFRKLPEFEHQGLKRYSLSDRSHNITQEDLSDTLLVIFDKWNRVRANRLTTYDHFSRQNLDERLGVLDVLKKIFDENICNMISLVVKDRESPEKNVLCKFVPIYDSGNVRYVHVFRHHCPVPDWEELPDIIYPPWTLVIQSSDYLRQNNVNSWLNKIRTMMGLEAKEYDFLFALRRGPWTPSPIGIGTLLELSQQIQLDQRLYQFIDTYNAGLSRSQ